jgi:hypothetical protein
MVAGQVFHHLTDKGGAQGWFSGFFLG